MTSQRVFLYTRSLASGLLSLCMFYARSGLVWLLLLSVGLIAVGRVVRLLLLGLCGYAAAAADGLLFLLRLLL